MKKILLVDDEDVIRQALARNLKKSGYSVRTAENGEAGLTCLQEGSYDILITDYLMAGITGLELITQAKIEHPEIRIILLSGYMEQNLEEHPTKADYFLAKPVGLDDLLMTIEKLLNQ